MAAVQSLGLHEPTALHYLVTESILPPYSTRADYKWETYTTDANSERLSVEEEIVTTKTCVVWSRGGVVKRVFRLDIEGESILDATVTWFPVSKRGIRHASSTQVADSLATVGPKATPRDVGQVADNTMGHAASSIEHRTGRTKARVPSSLRRLEPCERALVVILKSQAHIYFLAGDCHVVPMPFEATSVFPTPYGFVCQRQSLTTEPSVKVPAVPPNSFVTARASFDPNRSQNFHPSIGKPSRPSLPISHAQASSKPYSLPAPVTGRTQAFCLKDPHSRLGSITANVVSDSQYGGSDGMYDPLGQGEEILYISPVDEYSRTSPPGTTPLILALSWNKDARTYTVWTVNYWDTDNAKPVVASRRSDTGGVRSRRRSSKAFGLATGATTPIGRVPNGLGESFAHSLGISHRGHAPVTDIGDQRVNEVEDLASELGHDFGDIGASLKISRRVSSMLARADLATSHDRGAFTDIPSAHPAQSNMHDSKRRGESFGSFGGRMSTGRYRKSSIPGNESILSTGSGVLGVPFDHLSELDGGRGFTGPDTLFGEEFFSRLPRQMKFTKVETIPYSRSDSQSLAAEAGHHVFTMLSPTAYLASKGADSAGVSMCVMNKDSKELLVVNMCVERHVSLGTQYTDLSTDHSSSNDQKGSVYVVRAVDLRRGSDILDACKLVDGEMSRILILTQTQNSRGQMTLEAPWSSPMGIDLPAQLMIHNPFSILSTSSPSRKREGGLKRVISDPFHSLVGLQHASVRGEVDLIDNRDSRHRVAVWMAPHDSQVGLILSVCDFVLGNGGAGLRVAWWEVLKWLRSTTEPQGNTEFTALLVALFSMATPFIIDVQTRTPAKQSRKKAGLLRSSSGTSIDLSSWETMLDQEAGHVGCSSSWMTGSAWKWIGDHDFQVSLAKPPTTSTSRLNKAPISSVALPTTGQRNAYIINCARLAREFLKSPAGETASGPEGILPTAVGKDRDTRRTALGTILIGLHLLREEHKLHICTSEESYSIRGLLGPALAQLGGWMGWDNWSWQGNGYYASEVPSIDRWLFEDNRISSLEMPPEPFQPPSILSFAEACLQGNEAPTYMTILDVVSTTHPRDQRNGLRLQALKLTPRSLAITGFLKSVQDNPPPFRKIELMLQHGLTSDMIHSFPDGISAWLHDAIVACQSNPPTSWNEPLLELVKREDLRTSSKTGETNAHLLRTNAGFSHEASKDFHAIGNSFLETESFHSFDVSAEADRQSITRLIFYEDRRFQEASKLVNQTRPPLAECIPEPEWSESDLLEAQKGLVQLITMRTLAVPSGRGMINFSARVPLLTEKLPIPSFTLQCVMKPMNVTLSADRAAFTEEKVCWAFFHNGTATGLTISRGAKGIDTSWILYNKPPDLTNRHAGFLLALGLNGHLKSLAKWVAFKYLTPKHTMTSIGLLLGLAASYIGTMDTLITRLLSVHVTRMLPPGAAELNLSPLTQTTGIMGIGMLYCNSQHRRMSEVMLSEIENAEPEESPQDVLRDEGYRLAAGFALGLINLGKSKDLRGLHDMNIVERLLTLAIGTKNVDRVHVLDRATAGATVAIALIFLKSNDKVLAQKIDIPDTTHQFDYVRPDIFLLRTVAKHLILWDSIRPTLDWIEKNVPAMYRSKVRLSSIHFLTSEDMPFFNVVAGLCLSIGLRYAGSASGPVRDLLVRYLDQFIRLCRLPALNYDGKLTRNSVRNCQDVVALSAAAVMAGSGDLVVFRRLRLLHGRVDPDTPYGSHLAAHMAIGALFLGGGSYTLGTSNIAVAALLCAFYPLFPMSVLDNKCHLQAFRHLWVLAAESRCLVPRDVDTHRAISIPICLTMKDGSSRSMAAPCILPELSDVSVVKTISPEYWDVVLDFSSAQQAQNHLQAFQTNQSIYLRRRAAYDAPASSVFASALQALDDARPEPGVSKAVVHSAVTLSPNSASRASTQQIFDWVLELPTLKNLDMAERALVLPPQHIGQGMGMEGTKMLRGTVLDTRLILEHATLGSDVRDRLWQLRLLFAWADAEDKTGNSDDGETSGARGQGVWLKRAIIEGLRWRVWCMGAGVEEAAET